MLSTSSTPTTAADNRMTPAERHSSASLALVFALRMMGLFLIIPVFAIEARHYANANPASIGLALSIYGLTQALLQIPMGMASDRWGRKRVIAAGLLVCATGCVVAAMSSTIEGLLLGRAIQGAGAVSAAITALLADQTRDVVRTKAMAIIGGTIGLIFALALVIAPPLTGWLGLSGLFWLIAALSILALIVIYTMVPAEPTQRSHSLGTDKWSAQLRDIVRHPVLMRLNVGVFVLHATQMAMWLVLPPLLVKLGLAKQQHWQLYLPAIIGALLLMGGVLFRMERKGRLQQAFIASIVLILLVQPVLAWLASAISTWPQHMALHHTANSMLWMIAILLLVFFTGFNMLEASQPSLVSHTAPQRVRGMALGVYNTVQALGMFAGGALGGVMVKKAGSTPLFAITTLLVLLWLALVWKMPVRKTDVDAADSDTPPSATPL